MKLKTTHIVLCALFVALSYCVVIPGEKFASRVLREDGPIENATSIMFLIAATYFAATWMRARRGPDDAASANGRPIFHLGLAMLMFVCAGEEISWGQRIFNWKTPESLSAINAQNETNLHNLIAVEGYVRPGQERSFLRTLTNANRLFSIFWLACFVAVPLAHRISSLARSIFRRVGLPIAPLWIGGLFLLNYIVFLWTEYAFNGFKADSPVELDELKEMNYGIIFAVAGITALTNTRSQPSEEADMDPLATVLQHRKS